jgi:hypothetical protein
LHTITDACTPVCLFAAITSVEAVTPPRVVGTVNFTLPLPLGEAKPLPI